MGYLRYENGRNEQCKCNSYELLIPGVLYIMSKNGTVTCWLLRVKQMYVKEHVTLIYIVSGQLVCTTKPGTVVAYCLYIRQQKTDGLRKNQLDATGIDVYSH